ncbi:cytosine permease [Rhodococcus sp. HNM0569]|uniref:purine-cytosine permease family protein n=1 Tax=Rhodococcus sp. HNM0569 TaxID=2716340 RepID=UPI00146EF8A2|nr:cytosine permease [Rhodococcus sp. HNM0569]NLU83114.1 hypothetical protein [Rhodococcus sp. HNM0569]
MTETTGAGPRSLAAAAEDHALTRIPDAERRGGFELALSPIGVATALVIFAIGGYTVVLAGFTIGLAAGIVIAIFGIALGYALGRMGHATGVSSTITSRFFGFGRRGSAVGSLIFAFITLGFLAMESALLYEGTLLMFDLPDSWPNRIMLYGLLTLLWIALAVFGVKLALRTSALLTVVTLLVTVYLVVKIYVIDGADPMDVFTYAGVVQGGGFEKFETAVAVMGATAGTIALITADFARYCRTRRDVGILAVAGPLTQNVLMTVLGSLVVIGGMPAVVDYLVARDSGLTPEQAAAAGSGFVMGNTGAFFVIFAGWVGFVAIYASQAKAQAINAYSGSLSLVNLVDSLTGRKPGRAAMVVAGNIVALCMIGGGILGKFSEYLAYLGAFTLAMAGVMMADYYIVRRARYDHSQSSIENWNWAGMLTLFASAALGWVLMATDAFDLGFVVSLFAALVAYPLLRRVMPEGTATTYVSQDQALVEAE